MNAIIENPAADTTAATPDVTVTETTKAPRDKCKRAREIYDGELPNLEAMGKRAWRSHVLNRMQAELPCTLAASVAHFNNARIANGGQRRVLGPRKNKEGTGEAGTNEQGTSQAAAAAPSGEVWCVERLDGTKTWHIGEEAAQAVADELGDGAARIFRDLEVEAEG